MKNTYFLVGDLKAESQLATCGPALAKNKKEATPVPTYNAGNGPIMHMPGAGLRSKLRGSLCALMLEALEKRGERRFSLEDAQLNRVGGIKQAGAENGLPIKDYLEMIRRNPALGLFGASTPWVKGRAMVGHVSCRNPNLRPMLVEGVRSDILRREPDILQYLDDNAVDEYSADIAKTKAYTAIKKEMEALNKSARLATAEEKKKIQAEIKALEKRIVDENLKHVAAQQPLLGYMAIPPGAELDNKLSLVGVSQIEFGAFLAAMDRFAQAPVLGAHVAHGAGVVSGSWEVKKTGVGTIGQLTIDPFMGLDIKGDELVAAKLAFEEFVMSPDCQPHMVKEAAIAGTAEGEEGDGNE